MEDGNGDKVCDPNEGHGCGLEERKWLSNTPKLPTSNPVVVPHKSGTCIRHPKFSRWPKMVWSEVSWQVPSADNRQHEVTSIALAHTSVPMTFHEPISTAFSCSNRRQCRFQVYALPAVAIDIRSSVCDIGSCYATDEQEQSCILYNIHKNKLADNYHLSTLANLYYISAWTSMQSMILFYHFCQSNVSIGSKRPNAS